jgi:hypothetical protein
MNAITENLQTEYQRLQRHDAIMTERVLDLERQIDDLRRNSPKPTQWTPIAKGLPDADITVLMALDDGEVWPGYLDGDVWRYVTSDPIGARVTHWVDLPEAPAA